MILSYIRKSEARHLIYPILLLTAVLFLVWRSPVTEYLRMKTFSRDTLINEEVADSTLYAAIKTDNLHYTGQDCWEGSTLVGHYYYELVDGMCHYYLIKATPGYPAAEHLDNVTVTGRIDRMRTSQLTLLAETLAEGAEWESADIREISQLYYLNQTAYLRKREIVLMAVLVAAFVLGMADLIKTIAHIINPRLAPVFRNLSRYGNSNQILRDVERQMKKGILIQTKTLILTPGYLIELSEDVNAVIPLQNVLWTYDHAALSYGIRGKELTYTIHMVTDQGDEYSLKKKSIKEVEAIYHELTTRYPNYFYGYSKEHQEMVRYILKNN